LRETGISADDLEHYGKHKAKVSLDCTTGGRRADRKLVLVTAITPTRPAKQDHHQHRLVRRFESHRKRTRSAAGRRWAVFR